jgi:hypothetical protein
MEEVKFQECASGEGHDFVIDRPDLSGGLISTCTRCSIHVDHKGTVLSDDMVKMIVDEYNERHGKPPEYYGVCQRFCQTDTLSPSWAAKEDDVLYRGIADRERLTAAKLIKILEKLPPDTEIWHTEYAGPQFGMAEFPTELVEVLETANFPRESSSKVVVLH